MPSDHEPSGGVNFVSLTEFSRVGDRKSRKSSGVTSVMIEIASGVTSRPDALKMAAADGSDSVLNHPAKSEIRDPHFCVAIRTAA